MSPVNDLKSALQKASGADAALDEAIAQHFGVPVADYTASISQCRALAEAVLPGQHLHLGYGASGIFPYASIGNGSSAYSADAPTVPLAILRAILAGK